jgi:hypothetical protein
MQIEKSDLLENSEQSIVLPRGWVIPEGIHTINGHANESQDYRNSTVYNLPLAAKRAEELIDILYERQIMDVPLSYLRIDESTSFHILLLVSRFDFLSPKIHAARLLATQFSYPGDTFDMHFQFSVIAENMRMDSILAQGYRLMHTGDNTQNAA